MAKEYWTAEQAAAFLRVSMNNFRQITWRMQRAHEAECRKGIGFRSDCDHMVVDHRGLGKAWYQAERVKFYALHRRPAPALGATSRARQRKTARKFDR